MFLRSLVVYAGAGGGTVPGISRRGGLFGDESLDDRGFTMVFASVDGGSAPSGVGNRLDFASNPEVFENFTENCKKTLFIRRKMG